MMTQRAGKLFCELGLCVLCERVTPSTEVHQSPVSGLVFLCCFSVSLANLPFDCQSYAMAFSIFKIN